MAKTEQNIPGGTPKSGTADPAADPMQVAAEIQAKADAEEAEAKAKMALASKLAAAAAGLKIGGQAEVTLTTPYSHVHPGTQTRFLPNSPQPHVYDAWIHAMVEAKCMKAVPIK